LRLYILLERYSSGSIDLSLSLVNARYPLGSEARVRMKAEQSRNSRDVLRHIVPEIHNALAVILGNAQLLLLGAPVNPEDKPKLRAIERGSFKIQALIGELLEANGFASTPQYSRERSATSQQPIRAIRP
jgi:nitrogen-specific signal transduction histidine kinase